MTTHIRLETPEDFERLRALARRRSPAERELLYLSIGDILEEHGQALPERGCALVTEILRNLHDDIETDLRAKLARRLATNADVPRDVIVLLANDRIEVAYAILLGSSVLSNADLVEIVRHRTMRHRLAVAMRPQIGAAVSEALTETGNEDVLIALLDNHTAEISPELLSHLVDESRRQQALQAPLVSRPDLEQGLARRLYDWVGEALKTQIAQRYNLDRRVLDEALDGVVESALAADGMARENDPTTKVVDELSAAGSLTGPFLVNALKRGEVLLFEIGLARLAQVPLPGIRRVLYELDGEALGFACLVAGLEREDFITLHQLTRRARGQRIATDGAAANGLRAFYDATTATDAARHLGAAIQRPRHQMV